MEALSLPMLSSTVTSAPPGHFLQDWEKDTVSSFTVEGSIAGPSFQAQIVRYRWQAPPDTLVRPQMCHLDLTLARRSPALGNPFLAFNGCAKIPVGDCIFLPAGQAFTVESPARECRMLSCMFDLNILQPYLPEEWTAQELASFFDIKTPRIRQGLMQLAEEVLIPGFACEIFVEATATSLLVELARHFRNTRYTSEPSCKLSARQLNLIEERIASAVGPLPTLRQLALECGVSYRHLTRTFKNTMGRTLTQYITDVRVNQAKRLLEKRDALIKTVAYECGFSNQAAFAAAFRKATGWSPREFRRATLGLTADSNSNIQDQ